MDNVTLKKKLSTYLTSGGHLKNVSDEVLYELLFAWENWTGTGVEFYRSVGFTQSKIAGLIGKAKKLKREGHFGSAEFKQVSVDMPPSPTVSVNGGPCAAVEIVWTNGQVIRFSGVDYLMDFLKRSA